jgi:hypothetical protein
MDNRFSRHRPGKLDEQADIEEARMVLPGIQALFGFQLIAVFNERFKELTKDEQLIHFDCPRAYYDLRRLPSIGRTNDNIQVLRMARCAQK